MCTYISINGWFVKWLSSHSNSIMATIAVDLNRDSSLSHTLFFSSLSLLFISLFLKGIHSQLFFILIYNVYAGYFYFSTKNWIVCLCGWITIYQFFYYKFYIMNTSSSTDQIANLNRKRDRHEVDNDRNRKKTLINLFIIKIEFNWQQN